LREGDKKVIDKTRRPVCLFGQKHGLLRAGRGLCVSAGSAMSILEATDSRVPEIRERDLLVMDQSWMTKFVGSKVEIPAGVYLVSQQARLSVRQVLSGSADHVDLVRLGVKNAKERLRVGDDGFTVHGRVVWHGRSLPLPASTQSPASFRRNRTA